MTESACRVRSFSDSEVRIFDLMIYFFHHVLCFEGLYDKEHSSCFEVLCSEDRIPSIHCSRQNFVPCICSIFAIEFLLVILCLECVDSISE